MTTWDAANQSVTPSRSARTRLVHRNVDAWLIGGLSLLVFGAIFVATPKGTPTADISWTAFYLAYLVNGPHFFASYWHLYVDNARRLMEPRFAFAAFVVPAFLVVGLFVASQRQSPGTLGAMFSIMYLSVGWHYVKQIFGVTLVSSAAHGHPVSGLRKKLLRINLLTIWAMSWVFSNQYGGGYTDFNVPRTANNVTKFLRDHSLGFAADNIRIIIYLSVAVTGLTAVGSFIWQWVKTGRSLALVGWVAWASIYVWYLPVLAHPTYAYLIPFFHSLQYLLFSVTFAWNKANDPATLDAADTVAPDRNADTMPADGGETVTSALPVLPSQEELDTLRRKRFVTRFGLFVTVSIVLGAAGFHWIPEWLDRNYQYRAEVMGVTFWLAAFNVFINVHHYFVDSVIWRGSNPQMRAYLRPKPE